MTQDKLTRDQLADIIKAKYPQYSEMDNSELVDKIVAKYPVYNDQLIEEDLLKKKDAANMDSELVDGSLVSQDLFDTTDEFDARINIIDESFTDKSEEFVVPELQENFKQYGFDFEENAPGMDSVKILAPKDEEGNREELELPLKQRKVTTGGFGTNVYSPEVQQELNKQNAKKLQDFLKNNKLKTQGNWIQDAEKGWVKEQKNILTEQEVEQRVKEINDVEEQFNVSKIKFLENKFEYDNSPELQTPENKIKLQEVYTDLLSQEKDLKEQGKLLDEQAGRYAEMRSKQGSWAKGIWNGITDGLGNMASSVERIKIDYKARSEDRAGLTEEKYKQEVIRLARKKGLITRRLEELLDDVTAEELLSEFTDIARTEKTDSSPGRGAPKVLIERDITFAEDIRSEIIDLKKKGEKFFESYDEAVKGRRRSNFSKYANKFDESEGRLEAARKGFTLAIGSSDVTPEWSDAKKEGFWGGAILGLAESIPAMLAVPIPYLGFAQRAAQMYALVTDNVTEEMEDNPEFDNISEMEKAMVVTPIGIAVGVLESVGFRNLINQKGLINQFVLKGLRQVPKGSSVKTFREFIRQDIDSALKRGLLTIGAGGAAEFETGFAQQIAELSVKQIYNLTKEKEMFNTPDTVGEYVAEVLKAGAQEMVGGFIMSVPGAITNAATSPDMEAVSSEMYDMFEEMVGDPQYDAMFETRLKQKINATEGEFKNYTEEDAAKERQTYKELQGISANQIPDTYTKEQKQRALLLIYNINQLQKKIETTDDVLAEPLKAEQEGMKKELERMVSSTYDAQQEEKVKTEDAAQEEKTGDVIVSNEVADFQELVEGPSDTEVSIEPGESTTETVESLEGEPVEVEVETISDNITVTKGALEESLEKDNDAETVLGIKNLAVKAVKALSKVFPKVNIVLHENSENYKKIAGDTSEGTYDFKSNTIHINLPKASTRAMAHEVFHAVLLNAVKTDAVAQAVTKRMIQAVAKAKGLTPEIKKQIENFVSNYDQAIQDEERLAEIVGYIADNFMQLDAPTKSKIRKWVEGLLTKVGVSFKEFTSDDQGIIDMLNVVAKKTAAGEAITSKEISPLTEFKGGKKVDNPADVLKRRRVGSFEISYTQQESVEQLIKDGRVTQPENVSFLNNMFTTITSPDDMLAGEIKYDGVVIFEGEGGVFFVTKFGDVWASGKKGTAETIANALNKQLKQNGGKAFLTLTKGTDSKLVSSASGVNSTLAILNTMLDKKLISPSLFRSAVSNTVKKADGEINLRQSAKDLKIDIKKYFTDPSTSTFEKRGFIVKDIVGEIAKNIPKESQAAIAEFLGGDKLRSVAKGNTVLKGGKPGSQSLVDLIAKVAAEKLTKGLDVGDVYAVIEINGEVEVKKDSHPSYPFHIALKDGTQPILHLPENRQAGSEVLVQKGADGEYNLDYAVRNVSVVEGQYDTEAAAVAVGEGTRRRSDKKSSKKKETAVEPRRKFQYNSPIRPNYTLSKINTKNAAINLDLKSLDGPDSFEISTKNYKETEGVEGATIIGYVRDRDFPGEKKKTTRGEVFILQVNEKGKGIGTSIMLDALRLMKENGTKTVKFTSPSKEGKPFNDTLIRKGYIKLLKVSDRTGTSEYEITDKVLEETAVEPRRKMSPVQQLAVKYNMQPNDYFPGDLYNPGALRKEAARLGLTLKTSYFREGYRRGEVSGYYLKKGSRAIKPMSDPEPRRRKDITELGRSVKDIAEIVLIGRDNNVKETTIKDYLKRVRKFKTKEINDILKKDTFTILNMPKSFGNIKGGLIAGLNLFEKTKRFKFNLEKNNITKAGKVVLKAQQKLEALLASYQDELIDKPKKVVKTLEVKIKKAKTDLAALKKKYKGEKLYNNTKQEMMDQTIEYMQTLPEYQNEGDKRSLSLQQAKMEVDLNKAFKDRPTVNMAERMKKAQAMINERIRRGADLASMQRALRNYIRMIMPDTLYTKAAVTKMINKIIVANESNIDTIRNEVMDEANILINKDLSDKIKKLLNRKFQKVESDRVKANIIDRITLNTLNIIKKRIAEIDAIQDVEKLLELGGKIQNEINAAREKDLQSEQDQSNDAGLQILMGYVAAQVAENYEVSKTSALTMVYDNLNSLIETGRNQLEQQVAAKYRMYMRDFEIAYYEMTGQEIEMLIANPDFDPLIPESKSNPLTVSNPEAQRIIEKVTRVSDAKINKVKTLMKRSFGRLQDGWLDYIRGMLDLPSIMALISKVPGESFGGKLMERTSDRVDDASNTEKAFKMLDQVIIDKKMSDVYGKDWLNLSQADSVMRDTGIVKNSTQQEQAQKDYDKNPSPDNLLDLEQQTITASPNELGYLYNQYKDPANRASFEQKFGDEYERVMLDITKYLEDSHSEVLEIADWQVNELFPYLYGRYNETYRKVYRTDMPWNKYYAGRIFRDFDTAEQNENQDAPIDLIGNMTSFMQIASPGSTKLRQKTKTPIKNVDMMAAMINYMSEMNHFAAFGEVVNDINKLFTNPTISKVIEANYGRPVNNYIRDIIQKLANRGIKKGDNFKLFEAWQSRFVIGALAINPTVYLKQLTSFITYGNEIGYGNWIKYSGSVANVPEFLKIKKEILENSIYLQDRYSSDFKTTLETYSKSKVESVLPPGKTSEIVEALMFLIKQGDKGAILIGGVPNYMYYKDQYKAKNPNTTEQQAVDYAINKFEKDTRTTQQSGDLQNKDYYQTQTGFKRFFQMFQNSIKQYLRKEITSSRELYRRIKSSGKEGKGTVGTNLRTLFVYHSVLPVFFEFVSMGLPGIWADWEDEDAVDLGRAALIGNLNALFIVGDMIESIADALTDKPWTGSSKSLPPLQAAADFAKQIYKYRRTTDPEKKEKILFDAIIDVTKYAGVPGPQLQKLRNNIKELIEGGEDPGKVILRMFNFSEYQISGRKNKTKKRSQREINRELKAMDPSLYQELRNFGEDDDIKAMEKELKDLEKSMLEDLY